MLGGPLVPEGVVAVFVEQGAKKGVAGQPAHVVLDEGLELVRGVGAFLQVDGLDTVFAAGDITTRDPTRKLAFAAGKQAGLVVKNIVKHTAGRALESKDGMPPPGAIGFIALGPKRGVGQLPMMGGMVLGNFAVGGMKSKGLFAADGFKEVGAPVPKPVRA